MAQSTNKQTYTHIAVWNPSKRPDEIISTIHFYHIHFLYIPYEEGHAWDASRFFMALSISMHCSENNTKENQIK